MFLSGACSLQNKNASEWNTRTKIYYVKVHSVEEDIQEEMECRKKRN